MKYFVSSSFNLSGAMPTSCKRKP